MPRQRKWNWLSYFKIHFLCLFYCLSVGLVMFPVAFCFLTPSIHQRATRLTFYKQSEWDFSANVWDRVEKNSTSLAGSILCSVCCLQHYISFDWCLRFTVYGLPFSFGWTKKRTEKRLEKIFYETFLTARDMWGNGIS